MRTKKPGIIIALFSLVLAILATVTILDIVRREVQLATTHTLDSVQALVMRTTGLRLKYDYLSIDALNRFSMHGIELLRENPAPPAMSESSSPESDPDHIRAPIQLQRLSLRVSFWALITGHNSEVLRDIVADDLRISLLMPEDESIINKILENFSGSGSASLPHFMLTVGPVNVRVQEQSTASGIPIQGGGLKEGTLKIDSLQFSSLSGSPEIVAPSISAEINGLFGLPRDLSIKVGLQGSGAPDFSTFDVTMSASARTPQWLLMPQRLEVKKEGGRIEVRREGALAVRGWYEGGAWGVEGQMEGYRPGEDVVVEGSWGEVVRGVTVSGSVSAQGEGGVLGGYKVAVGVEAGEGVEVSGYKVGGMEVRVTGAGDGERYWGTVEGGQKGYRVRYEGVVGYRGMSVEGVYEVGGPGVAVKGEVRGGEGEYRVGVGGGEVKGIELGVGQGRVKMSQEGYEVGYAGAVGGGGVSVEGSIGKDGGYEGVVEARGIGAGSIGGLVGLKGVEGRVSGRVYGLVRGGKVSWSVSGGEYEGKVEGVGVKARVEGVGDEVGYEVKGAEVSVGGVTVGLKGKGSYKGKVFEGEVSAGGLAYGVEVTVAGERIGVKVGQTLVGGVTVAGGRVEGEVTLKDFGVGTGGGVVWLQGDVKGWYERGAWEGTVERLGVRYEGEGEYPEVLVSGTIDAKGAVLRAVQVKGKGYGLEGALRLGWAGGMYKVSGTVKGQGSLGEGALYTVDGSLEEKALVARLGVQGLKVGGNEVQGYLELKGEVDVGKALAGAWEEMGDLEGEGVIGLKGPGVSVVEQRLEVKKEGGRIEVRREGALAVRGWYEGGAWGVEGQMEGYRPGEDVVVEGSWGEVVRGVTVSGSVSAQGEGGVLGGYKVAVGVEAGEGVEVSGYKVGGMEVRVTGAGDGERYWGTVEGGQKGYRVRYEGVVGYRGMSVEGVYEVGGPGVAVKGEVRGGEGEYRVGVGGGEVKGIELGVGQGRVKMSQEGYEVGYAGAVGGGGVSVEGSIGKDGGYEGVVEARGIGAGSIGGLVGLKGVEGRVSGRVYGLVRGGKVSWSVSGGEYEGKVEGVGVKARVEGVGDEVGYEVKGAEVSVGGVTVGLKGKGSYKGKVFEGEVSAGGLAYGVEVTVAGERIGVKVGQTLVGGVTVAGGRVEGEVTLKDFGVGTGGGVVWLQGDVKGWYERGAWEGTVERLGVRYEGEGEYPEVLVSGTVDAKGANLAIDSIKYAGKQLKGTINVQYSSLMNPLKNMQALYSFTSIEDERAKIEGTVQALEGKITAAITGTSIPIEQFLSSSSNIAGDVQFQGTASISATGGKLSWADISLAELKFNCQKAEIKGIPFSAAGTISLKDNALSIHSGAFSYQNYKIDNIEAMYDLSKQKLEYALNAKIVIAEKLLSAFLKGTGDINGSIFDKEAFKNAQFSGEITEAKFESTVLDPITYVFSIADNNLDIHFSQANGDNAHASIRNMTEFELTIANLFNVNGSARGTIQANNIEADINLDSMDLSLLQIFLPQEDIKDISGNGSASMHLSGDISDPKIDGKILLNSVSFSSNAYLLEKVGPFNAEITINEGIIELSPTIVSIGTGNISVAATASLARWAIGDIKAFVSTGETASVKFKGTIAGLTAKDISLKADIKANISQSKLEISGNILLDNGILEVNPTGFIASEDTGQAAQPLSLNLAVTLGKNVELYIPSQDIPLVRGMSSPNSALTILYDQASGALSVNGKVELRSGYVLYLLRNFFIKQCSIDFSENQTKFNPLISTTAELREPSKDGIITITLSADRTPFENFNPRLSSIPPKSETELLALLGGGLALSDLADNNPLTLREAVIAGSEFLTQNSLFRSFEQRVQKALGVDVLYIQSSFIQRWLLDITDQTKSGQTPLSEYLTGTELFAGKYITDLAFAHFSLRMVQDPLEGTGPLQLDSELGLELQAPFGLLQWSMSLGKEGTPLNNQTLSLSWRINY